MRGPLDCLLDRFGEHELLGEQPHRLAHRAAHHRLAEARHHAPDAPGQIAVLLLGPARERAGKE